MTDQSRINFEGVQDARWAQLRFNAGDRGGGAGRLRISFRLSVRDTNHEGIRIATANTASGTMTLSFADCSNGTLEYDFPDLSVAGTVPHSRIADDTVALCEPLSIQ